MKELFRERDFTRVGYFQSILESEGIQTLIRNEHLNTCGLADLPIPEFFPALCVVDDADYDADYDEAVRLIRGNLASDPRSAEADVVCSKCGESSPANFDSCWNCGAPLTVVI